MSGLILPQSGAAWALAAAALLAMLGAAALARCALDSKAVGQAISLHVAISAFSLALAALAVGTHRPEAAMVAIALSIAGHFGLRVLAGGAGAPHADD
jgi:hypothetical protein